MKWILTIKGTCVLLDHVLVTVSISRTHLRTFFFLNPCHEGCYPMRTNKTAPDTHLRAQQGSLWEKNGTPPGCDTTTGATSWGPVYVPRAEFSCNVLMKRFFFLRKRNFKMEGHIYTHLNFICLTGTNSLFMKIGTVTSRSPRYSHLLIHVYCSQISAQWGSKLTKG